MPQHGSFINEYSAPAESFEVGDGATIFSWSDRTPYTVIEVLRTKAGKVKGYVLQEDNYERIDQNGMSDAQEYRYTPDPNGRIVEARVVASGRRKGQVYAGDRKVGKGRNRYFDFTF